METQSKPRVSPQQYEEMMKRQSPYAQGTIADLIERFMREFPDLGIDARYRLRKLQRHPIGAMLARDLKRANVIELCRERRKEVCAATVTHDVVCLSTVLKYAGSGAWPDCLDVSAAEVIAAKPFLTRHDLIGKSQPRERRPTTVEVADLEALFAKQNGHKRTKVDMVLLTRWQIASGRRIGESCKLLWEDWRRDDQTILVRKMKDPRKKNKQKVVALTPEAQAMLFELEAVRNPAEPRIFPYNSKTASARYTMAKIALGIENLRLHDSRRELGSRLVERGFTANEAIGFTGHETTVIFERVYCKPDVALLKNGPASRRVAA